MFKVGKVFRVAVFAAAVASVAGCVTTGQSGGAMTQAGSSHVIQGNAVDPQDLNELLGKSRDGWVAVEDRLDVLSLAIQPSYFKSQAQYDEYVQAYRARIAQLGCSLKPFGKQALNSGVDVLVAGDDYCLSRTRIPGDNYMVKLATRPDGSRSLFYATVVHPNSGDIAMHTSKLKSITWKKIKLFKAKHATIAQRGSTFILLPADKFESFRKEIARSKQSKKAEATEQATKKGEKFVSDRLSILDEL